MDQVSILGIRIDNLDEIVIARKLELLLSENSFHQIATVNPEFILESQKNQKFNSILNGCSMNVADGFGIHCAILKQGKKIKSRLAGADLMHIILTIAERERISVFLAARKDGLSSWRDTRKAMLRHYPDLKIKGMNIDRGAKICPIKAGEKTVLFCNFGAPHQEIFIDSQKNAMIGLGIGVGGSFDYLTGKVSRAPQFLRRIGLEWVWRAVQPQPWKYKRERLRRIWNSVVIFPIRIIVNKKNYVENN
jgi:N-acetylglucosaminyldiphosphoundecaprenol N-acetyl-beta-D-mannosaminyltransferase